MISRSLAIGLLAAGCVTAAAGGSYLAVRHNNEAPAPVESVAPAAEPATAPAVQESEGVVTPPEAPTARPEPADSVEPPDPPRERRVFPAKKAPANRQAPVRVSTEPVVEDPAPARAVPASAATPAVLPAGDAVPPVEPPAVVADPVVEMGADPPVEPLFEEIYIPASSVIGLELDTSVTSERARIEDRVDARVTRDVFASGRLAIPAGSRVIGAVTLVERGGKVKERARLGVRFHTLVLANGRQVQLRTEPVYREGDSPANESSAKIGGAAIGGAVLGAIIGGKKGAIAGATAGAAGGTAAVMAGGRNPATLPVGSVVTVKLAAPVSFEVER
jgi:type IV secretory pathway VirB10-like protein